MRLDDVQERRHVPGHVLRLLVSVHKRFHRHHVLGAEQLRVVAMQERRHVHAVGLLVHLRLQENMDRNHVRDVSCVRLVAVPERRNVHGQRLPIQLRLRLSMARNSLHRAVLTKIKRPDFCFEFYRVSTCCLFSVVSLQKSVICLSIHFILFCLFKKKSFV